MPVELVLRKKACIPRQRLNNISLGGVACNSTRGFRRGTSVELRIPLLGELARYPGVVAWCRRLENGYLVGIAFIDEDTLIRARMVDSNWNRNRATPSPSSSAPRTGSPSTPPNSPTSPDSVPPSRARRKRNTLSQRYAASMTLIELIAHCRAAAYALRFGSPCTN